MERASSQVFHLANNQTPIIDTRGFCQKPARWHIRQFVQIQHPAILVQKRMNIATFVDAFCIRIPYYLTRIVDTISVTTPSPQCSQINCLPIVIKYRVANSLLRMWVNSNSFKAGYPAVVINTDWGNLLIAAYRSLEWRQSTRLIHHILILRSGLWRLLPGPA